jgi:RHS repeat-associated protein
MTKGFVALCWVTLSFVAFSSPTLAANTPPMMVVPGKFDVNTMGAATYTIPIMVPPGTAGMKPDLSLDYSSNYADGPEGLGWAVGGLPAITRCARTVAQDGVHGGVNFDSNDRFCLNGQRLVAISGTYGADGTEYRLEIDSFTKIISYQPTGFTGAGPAYFVVWTKSGQEMQFGNLVGNPNGTAASSPLVPVTGSTTGPTGTVRSWALDTLWDTKGNYLRVIYDGGTPDIFNGQLYPTQINYTANDAQGLTAYNSVRFTYETRTDINPTYQAGSLLQFTKLLTDIKTYAGSTLVFDYQLGYQTAAQAAIAAGFTSDSANAFHDELRTVTQCPATGACLPTTTIGWQGGVGLPLMTTTNPVNNWYGGANNIFGGDFNGDGITDVASMPCSPNDQSIQLGTGGGNFTGSGMSMTYWIDPLYPDTKNPACFGFSSNVQPTIPFTGDIDGDGYSDVVWLYDAAVDGASFNWAFWLGNNRSGSLNQVDYIAATQSAIYNPTLADFNGDGKLDYFQFTAITGGGGLVGNPPQVTNVSGPAQIFLGNGDGTFTNGTSFNFSSGNLGPILQTPIMAADFDGDGCSDLLTQSTAAGTIFYSCNPAVPSISIPTWYGSGQNPMSQFVVGDFNGDGKADILIAANSFLNGNCTLSGLYESTGTGLTLTAFAVPNDWCKYQIVAGDFNGDGKTDIALIPPGVYALYGPGHDISIWLSTGTGFVQAKTIHNQDTYWTGSWPNVIPIYAEAGYVADWNSDGAADLWLAPTEWGGTFSGIDPLYTFAYKPELVTSISNGIGATTTITYGELNNPAVYTKGTGATYPTQDVASTQYVVSQVQTSNALNNNNFIKNYTYTGAKKDLSGRGFLGFTSVTMTDIQNDTATTTNYLMAFPFTGLVASQVEVCSTPNCPSQVTLKSIANCYSTSASPPPNCPTPSYYTLGSGSASRYFVPLRQTITQTTDQDGTKMPTVTTTNTYDCDTTLTPCYGNVTGIVSQSTDPNNGNAVLWTKTTNNTFANDADLSNDGDWLLGRLLTSSIESAFGTSDTTRHTSFCYDLPYATPSCAAGGNSGLLLTETLEPNATDVTLYLQSAYTYDPYGNKLTVALSGCLIPVAGNLSCTSPTPTTRTTSTFYDTVHSQFAWKVTNNLGESETWGTATSPGYDPKFGSPTKHTGPNGLTTTWVYDGFGHMTQETRPDKTNSNFSYFYCNGVNSGTDMTCPVTGPNNTNGAFSVYDTEMGLDSVHNVQVQINPTKTVYYDMLSRAIANNVQGFNNCLVRQDTIYDVKGRIYETNRPYFLNSPSGCTAQSPAWTVNSYVISGTAEDALGRVRKETRPDGGYTTYTYSGLQTTVTEFLAVGATFETVLTTKNAQGLTATVLDELGYTTTYAYDGFGDLLSTVDQNGNKSRSHYDLRGRKTSANDPDMGTWAYVYDSFGELYQQTDAKTNVVTMSYDGLGRLVQRSEPDMTSTWTYGSSATHHNIDKLVQETCSLAACANGNYTRNYTYDNKSRQSELDDYYGTTEYSATTQYDPISGKITTATAFSGFATTNIYSTLGYLSQIVDASSLFVYWQVLGRDAEMHATAQQLNGTTTGTYIGETQNYDPNSGRMQGICATTNTAGSPPPPCDGGIANFSYGWETNGNLLNRADSNDSNPSEAFCYDSLNRLTNYAQGAAIGTTCTSGAAYAKSVGYDAVGDITSKSDVGTYTYPTPGAGSVQPHAVSSIASCTTGCMNDVIANGNYFYDANGNLQCITAAAQCDGTAARSIAVTSFNMTQSVGPGTSQLALTYDPDHARAEMCLPDCVTHGPGSTATQYMNDPNTGTMSELVTAGASITWRNYILADGKMVAERFKTGSNAATFEYFITDHLGSVAVVTDSTGTVLSNGRLFYDPWGKMKLAGGGNDTNCALPQVPSGSPSTRGFTGQEQMPNICVDNFNARVYNPLLGRFLSPDSVIPDTYAPQSLNRYTYVDNMPLSLTDPSGHNQGYDWTHDDPEESVYYFSGSLEGGFNGAVGVWPGFVAHGVTDGSGTSSSGLSSQALNGLAPGTPLVDFGNGTRIVSDSNSPTGASLQFDGGSELGKQIEQDNQDGGTFKYAGGEAISVSYGNGSTATIALGTQGTDVASTGGGPAAGAENSSATQYSGNRYIYATDEFGRDAATVPDDPQGRFMIFAHGLEPWPGRIFSTENGADGGITTISLADRIAANPAAYGYTKGQNILLVVCYGGRGGSYSSAQILADALGVTVTAARELAVILPNHQLDVGRPIQPIGAPYGSPITRIQPSFWSQFSPNR